MANNRILIVEDDPLLALMFEDHLKSLGHTPAGCADCVGTALAQVDRLEIDAAIVDVVLVGGETSAPVADALARRRIPFVIATGGFISDPEPIFAGQPLLLKPCSRHDLEQALSVLGL